MDKTYHIDKQIGQPIINYSYQTAPCSSVALRSLPPPHTQTHTNHHNLESKDWYLFHRISCKSSQKYPKENRYSTTCVCLGVCVFVCVLCVWVCMCVHVCVLNLSVSVFQQMLFWCAQQNKTWTMRKPPMLSTITVPLYVLYSGLWLKLAYFLQGSILFQSQQKA